jgi:TolB protein
MRYFKLAPILICFMIALSVQSCTRATTTEWDIVYTRVAPSGFELYLADSEGTDQTQLTDLGGVSYLPKQSPNGRYLVFQYYDPYTELSDFFLVDLHNGYQVSALTSGGTLVVPSEVSWSPDSKSITYGDTQADGSEMDVYQLEIASGSIMDLTDNCDVWDAFPAWSPTGRVIAFVSDRLEIDCSSKQTDEIWLIDLETDQLRQLTNNHEYLWEDVYPSWSPDGTRLAFYRFAYGGEEYPGGIQGLWTLEISTMDEELQVELPTKTFGDSPIWSPDGKYIAYLNGTLDENDIWIASVEGHDPIQLTDLPGSETLPSWSPDSKSLLFTYEKEGAFHLAVVSILDREVSEFPQLGEAFYGIWISEY